MSDLIPNVYSLETSSEGSLSAACSRVTAPPSLVGLRQHVYLLLPCSCRWWGRWWCRWWWRSWWWWWWRWIFRWDHNRQGQRGGKWRWHHVYLVPAMFMTKVMIKTKNKGPLSEGKFKHWKWRKSIPAGCCISFITAATASNNNINTNCKIKQ